MENYINMENNIKQLLISGVLGDGCLIKGGSMFFSCLHKEYMDFKYSLASGDCSEVKETANNGYKKGATIFKTRLKACDYGKYLLELNLKEQVEDLDELGLAMWLYDDGSLHKTDLFYNINTHSFSREDEENVLIPLLNKFNIYPKIITETKKDGRVFSYLYVSKYKGAFEINKILNKYPLDCYSYKLIPKKFVTRYEKVKERFKGSKISILSFTKMLNKEVENFDMFLENFFINKEGFVTNNKHTKYIENEKTLIL